MADETYPWWCESESVAAHHLRGGYDRVAQRVQLTFGKRFKSPPDQPTNSPTIGFRVESIQVGSIELYAYGYVVRWHGDGVRSAYKSWIGALRGGKPPVYINGGGVVFDDVESSKLAVASFLAYYVSDVNLGSNVK